MFAKKDQTLQIPGTTFSWREKQRRDALFIYMLIFCRGCCWLLIFTDEWETCSLIGIYRWIKPFVHENFRILWVWNCSKFSQGVTTTSFPEWTSAFLVFRYCCSYLFWTRQPMKLCSKFCLPLQQSFQFLVSPFQVFLDRHFVPKYLLRRMCQLLFHHGYQSQPLL